MLEPKIYCYKEKREHTEQRRVTSNPTSDRVLNFPFASLFRIN